MAMLDSTPVEKDKVSQVLEQFHAEATEFTTVSNNASAYIKSLFIKALGPDKGELMISRVLHEQDTSGIDGLKWMDPMSAAELIKDEHPQVIASILVHLERDQCGAILNEFNERLRSDVMLRIATLDGIQPSALKELNEVLLKSMAGSGKSISESKGGVNVVAKILGFVNSASEAQIIESVREHDPELAQKIQDQMFTFDSLLGVDDRGIQTILREVQGDSLVIALKGASVEMREKIFKNMSSRAAETVRDDLDSKGPVKLSEVDSEQKEIIKIMRRIAEEGQITVAGRGEDEYV
jgi:flagellar motor switch protein FliG